MTPWCPCSASSIRAASVWTTRPGGLIVDFEWRSSREVVTGIAIGLVLGFDHGRTSALIEAEDLSERAATLLMARLPDFIRDTEAGGWMR